MTLLDKIKLMVVWLVGYRPVAVDKDGWFLWKAKRGVVSHAD